MNNNSPGSPAPAWENDIPMCREGCPLYVEGVCAASNRLPVTPGGSVCAGWARRSLIVLRSHLDRVRVLREAHPGQIRDEFVAGLEDLCDGRGAVEKAHEERESTATSERFEDAKAQIKAALASALTDGARAVIEHVSEEVNRSVSGEADEEVEDLWDA